MRIDTLTHITESCPALIKDLIIVNYYLIAFENNLETLFKECN